MKSPLLVVRVTEGLLEELKAAAPKGKLSGLVREVIKLGWSAHRLNPRAASVGKR